MREFCIPVINSDNEIVLKSFVHNWSRVKIYRIILLLISLSDVLKLITLPNSKKEAWQTLNLKELTILQDN